MAAQSALAVYFISDVAANTVGLLKEANLLTRQFVERATRSQQRITGFSGSTIHLNECDPVLTIDITGWVLTRGGLANIHPGSKINGSIIANWRNGATNSFADEGPGGVRENHFGWDVLQGWNGESAVGINFIARSPTFTRTPGRLSEFSVQLALECTAGKSRIATLPPNNSTDPPPSMGTVWYLAVVYTDQGSYIQSFQDVPPTAPQLFHSAVDSWGDGPRYISGFKPYDAEGITAPLVALGVAVSGLDGVQEYLVGSSGEVTGGGQDLLLTGPHQWVLVYPVLDEEFVPIPPHRSKMKMVCGNLPDLTAMLASLDPPGSEDEYAAIYHHGTGWVKNLPEPINGNALEWFQN